MRGLFEKHGLVGGVDEVGVSAIAGPLCAAAVVFDAKGYERFKIELRREGFTVRKLDSKALKREQREAIVPIICRNAMDYAVGLVNVSEIESLSIFQASKLAMERAFNALKTKPKVLLSDYHALELPVENISGKKADARWPVVGAASILAKVFRDEILRQLSKSFEPFDFASNVGYPSPKHKRALYQLGFIEGLHRTQFKYVRRAKGVYCRCHLWFKTEIPKEKVDSFLEVFLDQ